MLHDGSILPRTSSYSSGQHSCSRVSHSKFARAHGSMQFAASFHSFPLRRCVALHAPVRCVTRVCLSPFTTLLSRRIGNFCAHTDHHAQLSVAPTLTDVEASGEREQLIVPLSHLNTKWSTMALSFHTPLPIHLGNTPVAGFRILRSPALTGACSLRPPFTRFHFQVCVALHAPVRCVTRVCSSPFTSSLSRRIGKFCAHTGYHTQTSVAPTLKEVEVSVEPACETASKSVTIHLD
jgi:hypothetical protein